MMKHIKTILFCNVLLYSLGLLAQNIPVQQMPAQQPITEPESLYCQAFYKALETILDYPEETKEVLDSLPEDFKEPITKLVQDPSISLLKMLDTQTVPLAHCSKEKIINVLKQKANKTALSIYEIAHENKFNLIQMLLYEVTSQKIRNKLAKDYLKDHPASGWQETKKILLTTLIHVIRYIIDAGININEKINNDPLIIAVIKLKQANQQNQDIVDASYITYYELFKHNVDINAVDQEGNSALMYEAAMPYSLPSLDRLLKYPSMNVNQKNNNGENAILYMIRHSRLPEKKQIIIAKKLIEDGINIFERDNNGMNAWDEVKQKNKPELLKLFEKHLDKLISVLQD